MGGGLNGYISLPFFSDISKHIKVLGNRREIIPCVPGGEAAMSNCFLCVCNSGQSSFDTLVKQDRRHFLEPAVHVGAARATRLCILKTTKKKTTFFIFTHPSFFRSVVREKKRKKKRLNKTECVTYFICQDNCSLELVRTFQIVGRV